MTIVLPSADQSKPKASPEGKSVTFRYRVLIHEGEFGPPEIAAAYTKYASEK